MKLVYIAVNGIANLPESVNGWTDTFIKLCASRRLSADKYEYLTTFATRFLFQWWRARQLAKLVEGWVKMGFIPVLVGHSNGCDLLLRVVNKLKLKNVDLHLIAGACEPDWDQNGLNRLMADGVVRRVTVYMGGRDWVLKELAPRTRRYLQVFGLGFKNLGGRGPVNVATSLAGRVMVVTEPHYGHSTWFGTKEFPKLMKRICNN